MRNRFFYLWDEIAELFWSEADDENSCLAGVNPLLTDDDTVPPEARTTLDTFVDWVGSPIGMQSISLDIWDSLPVRYRSAGSLIFDRCKDYPIPGDKDGLFDRWFAIPPEPTPPAAETDNVIFQLLSDLGFSFAAPPVVRQIPIPPTHSEHKRTLDCIPKLHRHYMSKKDKDNGKASVVVYEASPRLDIPMTWEDWGCGNVALKYPDPFGEGLQCGSYNHLHRHALADGSLTISS